MMTFMIVGMRQSIPYVVKAVPEVKMEGKWLADEIGILYSESYHRT